jgi:hypothetical protein
MRNRLRIRASVGDGKAPGGDRPEPAECPRPIQAQRRTAFPNLKFRKASYFNPQRPLPLPRRPRRPIITIDEPIAISSRPMPTVQRRSRPVNGSVPAAAFSALGPEPLDPLDVVLVGSLLSFDGEVPAAGVGVVGVGVLDVGVGVVDVAVGVVVVVGGGGVWL